MGAGSFNIATEAAICSTSRVEILMVLGTESDITELIDRFTVRNLTTKRSTSFWLAHLKNPPLEFSHLSS